MAIYIKAYDTPGKKKKEKKNEKDKLTFCSGGNSVATSFRKNYKPLKGTSEKITVT